MFSSLRIAENLQTLDMLDQGGKFTYVDVRQPGSSYSQRSHGKFFSKSCGTSNRSKQ
jgi:hypothetical protein